MSQQTIRAYFESKIATWAAAQVPVIPVAYENKAFIPPNSGTYLELYLLPAFTLNPFVSATNVREGGIYRVNVVGDPNKGSKDILDKASAIVNLFPVVPKDNIVSVEQTPHIAAQFQKDSGRPCVPVSISYRLEG